MSTTRRETSNATWRQASGAARLCSLLIALVAAASTIDAHRPSGESATTMATHQADDPHVRIDDTLTAFADELAARSPTVRHLLQTLARSDVVAHVKRVRTLPLDVAGWLSFLTAAGGHRHLLVQIRTPMARPHLAATLGHELWHAVEVARMPAVMDADSFTLEYSRIGFLIKRGPPPIFETDAAVQIGKRVLAEFAGDGNNDSSPLVPER
jgi:hypothetical protein